MEESDFLWETLSAVVFVSVFLFFFFLNAGVVKLDIIVLYIAGMGGLADALFVCRP